jgi:predicted ATPase
MLDELLGFLAAGTGGTDAASSNADRFPLFERVADALVTTADAQGLVILLDDLQWADAASLLLLQHVVTHRRRARLMIGATIRSGETALATLGGALHHIGRSSSARRFDLAGFDRDDVAAQLAALGHDPTAEEVDTVANRTGGNPLFVRETGWLIRPGETLTVDRVPDAVRVVLAQRMAPLPPTSRRTVAIASAVGTDVDLVHAISGRSAEDVLDDLAEAERVGILSARPRGTVPRFVHDLMRDALQEELSAGELAGIHLTIAEELERRGGYEAAIAHHRLAALPVGDARAAIGATLAAARAAMMRLAFEDAAALFERGLASSAAGDRRVRPGRHAGTGVGRCHRPGPSRPGAAGRERAPLAGADRSVAHRSSRRAPS